MRAVSIIKNARPLKFLQIAFNSEPVQWLIIHWIHLCLQSVLQSKFSAQSYKHSTRELLSRRKKNNSIGPSGIYHVHSNQHTTYHIRLG